ncbi:PepSY domain-containing protein [Nitrospira sp. BLG_2]|uniref:PepSY domain-containing protein n=1 Tax=Nitrospira sp. BLG_2 TaxID=3397507 RepID=UPI003B9DA47B
MRYFALPFALMFFALSACSSQEKMARSTHISMPDAIRTAEASIPGSRAIESHLEKESDHTVYEVQLADNQNNRRTVWIDAYSGRIIKKTEP